MVDGVLRSFCIMLFDGLCNRAEGRSAVSLLRLTVISDKKSRYVFFRLAKRCFPMTNTDRI